MMKKLTLFLMPLLLSACIVVPAGKNAVVQTGKNSAQSANYTYSARLYPTNKIGEQYGIGSAEISSKNGYSIFHANIGGTKFSGEANRDAKSSVNSGRANGSSASGQYLSCDYTMNGSNGKGSCKTSDGGTFDMHITG